MKRDEMPYRQSTLGIVVSGSGKFLVVNKTVYQDNQWSFPGGGIDEGESPEQALKRELVEELNSNKFEVIGQSQNPYVYEWPDPVIEATHQKKGKYFRGTHLTQFWVKFTGSPDEVRAGDGIKTIKWITQDELKTHLVFPNQLENTKKVIQEFS